MHTFMEVKENKFKNFILYGGTSKEEFEQIKPLINARNLKTWQVNSIVLEILFLILFIVSIIVPTFSTYTPYFGGLAVYTILLVLVLLLAVKPTSKVLLPLLYFSLAAMLTTLLLCFVIADASLILGSALVFPAILVCLPFFLIDRPIRPIILFFTFGTAFTVFQTVMNARFLGGENPELAWATLYQDLIIGIIFTFISIALAIYIIFVSFKRLANIYHVEKERDTDALTGVKNAIAYDREVADITNKIKRKVDFRFAIVVCDINGLKSMNDTFGHRQGDNLIIRAAKLLKGSFKTSYVYRIGGDEFVVIVTGVDYVSRDQIVRNLKEKVEQIHNDSKSPLEDTSIALGISTYSKQNDYDYVTIFSRADEDMYNNKHLIKNKQKILDE